MTSAIRVSHSQIQKWDRCRFAWTLSYVGKWRPKQKSDALSLGSMVHDFLEKHYCRVKNGEPATVDAHVAYVRQQMPQYNQSEIELVSRAAELVRRYIAEYAPLADQRYKVLDVEGYLCVPLTSPGGNEFEYELYYDLLLEDVASKKIWLVDHKTHNSRPYGDSEILMDPQLSSYAAGLRTQGVQVFGVIYNLLNTYEYKNPKSATTEKLFTRKTTYRSPEEMDSIIREIGYTVDDILANQENPRRSLKRDCSWCEFQDPCLMGMKGIPMLPILETSFEKKPERPRDEENDSDS